MDSAYRADQAAANQAAEAAHLAGDHATAYILTTILLAAALFLAGVTSSTSRAAPVLLIVLALVTVAYAAARLADLPVA